MVNAKKGLAHFEQVPYIISESQFTPLLLPARRLIGADYQCIK